MKKILSVLVIANMMFLSLSTAINQQDLTSTVTTISLCRDVDSLEESVEEADIVISKNYLHSGFQYSISY